MTEEEAKARTLGRDALWSAYVYGAGLQPERLPPPMQPIVLAEALRLGSTLEDAHAPVRAGRLFRQAAFGALRRTVPARARSDEDVAQLLNAVVGGAPDASDLIEIVEAVQVALAATGVGVSIETLMALVSTALRAVSCIDPTSKTVIGAPNTEPVLLTSHVVLKSLAKVAESLDPRFWDYCADLFTKTGRVRDVSSFPYALYDPDPIPRGTPWCGHMYERAEIPGQCAENVLRVSFERDDLPSGPHSKLEPLPDDDELVTFFGRELDVRNAPLRVRYSLFHNFSYRIGGLTIPGIEVCNSGTIVAVKIDTDRTRVCSSKRITYGRLTSWSGAGLWDYGAALTYAAPAMLNLWTDELHLVVPCC